MVNKKPLYSLVVNSTILLFCIFIAKAVMRHFGIEGFNPFQQFYQQFLNAQKELQSFGFWVGYAYRTSNLDATAEVLNDFKRRAFQDGCEFRDNWPNPPSGMPSPNGATTAVAATAAYQAYIRCLKSGNVTCYNRLNDARARFMKPGCQFRNPIDTSEPITVAFK